MNIAWIAAAAVLAGRTVHVALAVWSLVSVTGAVTVTLSPAALRRFGVSREAAHDALGRLAAAGLVVLDRQRGRHPRVTLLGTDGRPLVLPADFPFPFPA